MSAKTREITAVQGAMYIHNKSGHVYRVVGFCMMEREWKEGVLYRRENPRQDLVIVRDRDEFEDGRFSRIES